MTLLRLLAAERLHRDGLFRELFARLEAYDDGSRARRLRAPTRVRLETDPPEASLTLARYREDAARKLVAADGDPSKLSPGAELELEPGSYLILALARDRYTTRYPFVVRRGEARTLRISLPRAADVPAGMIYVPAGRTLYGSIDDEETRLSFGHQPAHDVEVAAFLMAWTEVTNGDYIDFLDSLPEPARSAHLPWEIRFAKDGRPAWSLRSSPLAFGEPYCHAGEPCIDWTRLPLETTNRRDAEDYVDWLSRSGRLPGARLCTD